ncbi:PspC domain-containing protein [Nostocoides sp. F2B08]|uniref:PspC domain-containing protein n=1 Tax=Nostocoides sp. F2B08 TaxID=2653936 RepID=UPI00186B090B|nr:PspC domain-containing protein [Tetrasphaera sp. F2B08]
MNDTQPHEQVSPLTSPPPQAGPPPSVPPQSESSQHGGAHTDGDPTSPQSPRMSADGFFDQIRSAGIRRSQDRWVAGVCGGIAQRLHVDPLLIRAGMIALLLLGVGFLAYLIAWALIPDKDDSILAEKAIREGDGWGIFLLVIIALGVLGIGPVFSDAGGWWSLIVTVALIAGVWWLVTRARSTSGTAGPAHTSAPPPAPGTSSTGRPEPVWAPASATPQGYEPPPARPHASASTAYDRPKAPRGGFAGFLLALGAAIVGYGVGQLVGPLGGASADLVAMLFAAAAGGLTTVVLGLLGRRSALTSLLSIILAVSLLGTWGITTAPEGGGSTTWEPTAQSLSPSYEWNAGQATLDLRQITTPPAQDEITADVSLGELVIYVPEGITTRIVSSAELGSVTVQGADPDFGEQNQGGPSVDAEHVFGVGEPDLTVNATVRLGSIRIVGPSEQR